MSVFHFGLIFMKDVRSLFNFIFLACEHPIVLAPFVEETVFVLLYCLCFSVNDQLPILMWVCFRALSFVVLITSTTLSSSQLLSVLLR